jgi:hypothetical protein
MIPSQRGPPKWRSFGARLSFDVVDLLWDISIHPNYSLEWSVRGLARRVAGARERVAGCRRSAETVVVPRKRRACSQ